MSEHRLVPVEILDRFPEINPSNYSHDDACALNAWGVELVLAAAPAPEQQVKQEPVAYRYRHLSEDWEGMATSHPSGFHPDHTQLIVEPLYTAPPAAPDVSGLVEALAKIAQGEIEEDGFLVAMSGEECMQVAYAALSAHREK